MIEKIKKTFAWIQNNSILSGFLGSLAAGIIMLIAGAVIGGITFKMIYETLINLDFSNVFGTILLIIAAILGIFWARQRWENRIEKKEEEIRNLKSNLEEKTKRYDELAEKTKPPSNVITIREHNIARPLRGEVSKYPSLRFTLEVINRSYISFKSEKVEIACYNKGEKVGEDYWEKGMEKGAFGYDSAKGYISVSSELARYGGGSINFEVPIEKEYEHLKSWDLHGYVKYTDGEKEFVAKINTKHYLSKQAEEDLERKLKEAIGEGKWAKGSKGGSPVRSSYNSSGDIPRM